MERRIEREEAAYWRRRTSLEADPTVRAGGSAVVPALA